MHEAHQTLQHCSLPADMSCARLIAELSANVYPPTDWELDFCKRNRKRSYFSDKQKECVIAIANRLNLKRLLT